MGRNRSLLVIIISLAFKILILCSAANSKENIVVEEGKMTNSVQQQQKQEHQQQHIINDNQALVIYDPNTISNKYLSNEHDFYLGGEIQKNIHIAHGGRKTGSRTWECSQVIADYFARNPTLTGVVNNEDNNYNGNSFNVVDKNVVEIGSGCSGLLSLTLSILGSKVIATDGEPSVLDYLQENAKQYKSLMKHPLETEPLLWGGNATEQFVDLKLNGIEPDLVVASDVVFGEDFNIWRGLVDTFKTLMITSNCLLIYGHTTRYAEKEKFFWKLMKKTFLIEEIDGTLFQWEKYFDGAKNPNSKIYKIRRQVDLIGGNDKEEVA